MFDRLRSLGKLLPKADVINEAGGPAYAFGPEHALAQYAATGCLNGTFYASAQTQLDVVLKLAFDVEGDFLAKIDRRGESDRGRATSGRRAFALSRRRSI